MRNSDHVVVSVSINFPSNLQRDAPFHRIAYDYSCADWDSLCDHLRDVPWEDIFKLGASDAASEFCVWFQVGIDVYIPHRKYQIKPNSMVFSCLCCCHCRFSYAGNCELVKLIVGTQFRRSHVCLHSQGGNSV